jgi:hypothetical protein
MVIHFQTIHITRGVGQGCRLSSFLRSSYLNKILKDYKIVNGQGTLDNLYNVVGLQ